MADPQNLAGLDGTQSVSALGLRWAALRGMLNSPLIMAEDQRHLRDELLRELGTIEQDFSNLPSRNPIEISAKVDIAKAALQDGSQAGPPWLVTLLESIQADLQSISGRPTSGTGAANRPVTNLTRNQPRPDEGAAAGPEAGAPSAA